MEIEAIHEVHAHSADGKKKIVLAPGQVGDVLEKDALYLTRPDVGAAAFLTEAEADAASRKSVRTRRPRAQKDVVG